MAGIIASSASKAMVSGDTSASDVETGYVAGEQITLSTSPAGSAYSWGIAIPAGASAAATALSSTTAASPTFTPEQGISGEYVITCTVDSSTSYVIRLTVVSAAPRTVTGGIRMLPRTAASITAPSTGEVEFYDSTLSRRRAKNSAGTIRDIDPGARTGTFTLSSGAASVADTSVTASTVIAHHCSSASNRGTLVFTLNAGVGFDVASSDGSDASAYRYALIN